MDLKSKNNTTLDAKKVFSKIGLATAITIITVNVLQILMYKILGTIAPEIISKSWFAYITIAVSFYLIGFPLFYLLVKNIPNGQKKESKKLSILGIIKLILITYSVMYIINLLTTLIITITGLILGNTITNPLNSVILPNSWIWNLVFAGILSPIIEELMFRGVMLNKLRCYGDKIAIITTAVLFGLFHGNFHQFFYTAAIGAVFAYITLKTGTIKYSIILHITINILGGVLPSILLSYGDNLLPTAIFGLGVIVMVIVGTVLFIKNVKKINILPGNITLEKGQVFKTTYLNLGMILNLCVCLFLMIYVLVS